ncbi:PREDICTED: serine/threonine-protein kinase LMTK1 [Myotis davidii]|uniref:serine/threonine-protein kinase LMTK1 n=1 Tax=Myotis davidii TaxID=225400 RepID=UPI0007673343|nr:PREDICTED: serine/threonine-protein kinase LMTK1 [Myotis davidii]
MTRNSSISDFVEEGSCQPPTCPRAHSPSCPSTGPSVAPPTNSPWPCAQTPPGGRQGPGTLRTELPQRGAEGDGVVGGRSAGCAPSSKGPDHKDSDGAAALLAMEPPWGQTLSTDGPCGHSDHHPRRSPTQDPPCPSCSPLPGGLMLVEARVEDADSGVAALCQPVFEDPLGASTSGTSGPWLPSSRRSPESWVPGCTGGHTDDSHTDGSGHTDSCLGRKHGLQAVPELGHPLAPADPREPLHGPEGVCFGREPGCCLDRPCLCPVEGLAPARGLVTHPWTEAAVSGGHGPQTEPRCAEEAEGPAGPQVSLPSIPTPSLEGAQLPTEEASAPTALPASPTPASSQAAAMEPAPTWDGGSSCLELEAPGSEDEDTTEATSGVCTDLSSDGLQAEKPDSTPAIRSLQKQVGTPDSLDSLDIPSSASDGGCEVCSPPAVGTPGGQPRALDSGYDTENYESPEFVLKEAPEPCEPEASGRLAPEGESPGVETQLRASLSGLSEKNPYRDSAYFSDLDTEPEPPSGSEKGAGGVPAPGPEPDMGSPQSPGLQPAQPSEPWVPGEAQIPGPRELSPLPLHEDSSPGPIACPTGPGAPLCLALAGLPAAPEGRLEEEEEDSEDSDESDEELRSYMVQEPSEESEEGAPPVPVVVAESQSARRLRSLLKMPGLLPAALREDLERKKKAVSFFDDVTGLS